MEEGNEALFCKMSRGGWQGGRPHDDRYMSKMNKMNENKKSEQKQKGGRDLDSDLADGLEQRKRKNHKKRVEVVSGDALEAFRVWATRGGDWSVREERMVRS